MMYHFAVHLLYASMVGCAAWLLTSIRAASATAKYWTWVVTTVNFVVPSGVLVDKLWAPHVTWSEPLRAIVGLVRYLTQGRTTVVLVAIWMAGGLIMLARLISRLWKDCREIQFPADPHDDVTSHFKVDGILVAFDSGHPAPIVAGVLSPRILLPVGIDKLLNRQELDAVLVHEITHAKRHDNLIRLLYEVSLCILWFHPLIWLVGARMALYRELSCDESVVQRAQGPALVRALAKLAVPEEEKFLQATASSHLGHRLARLAGSAQVTRRPSSLLLTSLFATIVAAGVFETVAHTACCFALKH